jgi:cysteine sulfinate desulfinase/cysteine desulfurase-like protein
LSDEQARASIRFGLGRMTNESVIDGTVAKVADVTKQLRKQRN